MRCRRWLAGVVARVRVPTSCMPTKGTTSHAAGSTCTNVASKSASLARAAFVARHLPDGLHRGNFSRVPFLVFNRKDDMQRQWVSRAFGVREPRLRERFVPSSEAYARAARMGWGVGVVPLLQVHAWLERGELVPLCPEVTVPVALYWHRWKLGDERRPGERAALISRIGDALIEGARRALLPLEAEGGSK